MISHSLFKEKHSLDAKVSVIVPVKNEGEVLKQTLDALYNQLDTANNVLDKNLYEVLLLTNNCTDNSLEIALSFQSDHPDFNLFLADINLPSENAHIGYVRRLLMDEAYNRFLTNNKPDGIIASTDGDTEVDSQWVFQIIAAMSKGIDAVGGRIISKHVSNQSRQYHLQNVAYRYYVSRLETVLNPIEHDPWPRHFQCFGPSMAVTCTGYVKAGRLPILPSLEDEEFRKSLYRVDAKVRMCPKVKVYTSSRLSGKVPFGFSTQLQTWADMSSQGKTVYVESLESLIEKYHVKYLLKNCWLRPLPKIRLKDFLNTIAGRLHICPIWLQKEFSEEKYFGSLWEKIELKLAVNGEWEKQYPKASIEKAILAMRQYFSDSIKAFYQDIA